MTSISILLALSLLSFQTKDPPPFNWMCLVPPVLNPNAVATTSPKFIEGALVVDNWWAAPGEKPFGKINWTVKGIATDGSCAWQRWSHDPWPFDWFVQPPCPEHPKECWQQLRGHGDVPLDADGKRIVDYAF